MSKTSTQNFCRGSSKISSTFTREISIRRVLLLLRRLARDDADDDKNDDDDDDDEDAEPWR